MSKYSELEQQINRVLIYQHRELEGIKKLDSDVLEGSIAESENVLRNLGYELPSRSSNISSKKKQVMVVPTWESLCREAEQMVGMDSDLEPLFSAEELEENSAVIRQMNREFNMLHHLDKYDVAISATAGILAAAVDILLVGIPQKTPSGLSGGKLSDFIRKEFDKKFPEEEMKKLANSKGSKVPYDAQDNRHTSINVDGLSAYYHRLISLGHDPLLGFVFGVADILTGRMTTIDKSGKIVSQIMEIYTDRKESDIFEALSKQIIHLKSDITTSMGIPAPMMSLFNLLQLGSIGEEEKTIAEIVQEMYGRGYDFIHFCSLSVPAMVVEVVARIGYAFKRIKEGHSIKDSIPISLRRDKHPKLATMLFIGHAGAAAVNAGKIYFTKNPMAINYPQWLAFAKYSYSQMKWALLQKPELQDRYVSGRLYEELEEVMLSIDHTFDDFAKDYIVVIE